MGDIFGHTKLSDWAKDSFGDLAKAAKAVAHGGVGGAVSVAQGRDFKSAFLTGVVTEGTAGSSPIVSILAGGAASALSGGKFEDGVFQAAMIHVFNRMGGLSAYYQKTIDSIADKHSEAILNFQRKTEYSTERMASALSNNSTALAIGAVLLAPFSLEAAGLYALGSLTFGGSAAILNPSDQNILPLGLAGVGMKAQAQLIKIGIPDKIAALSNIPVLGPTIFLNGHSNYSGDTYYIRNSFQQIQETMRTSGAYACSKSGNCH